VRGTHASILFVVVLAAEFLTALAVTISIVWPARRVWPPSSPSAWGGYAMWLFFLVAAGGDVALGISDWGGIVLPAWLRWGAGVSLWVGGLALGNWAILALSLPSTCGVEGALVHIGPYRFSRNPQYVGFSLALLGWGLVASSGWALIAAPAGILPLLLAPFAEEPWLAARHGAAYEAYRQSAPRFLGLISRARR
jgi:protein-S-isoprenylcysteine O-methyltransferase Ste14